MVITTLRPHCITVERPVVTTLLTADTDTSPGPPMVVSMSPCHILTVMHCDQGDSEVMSQSSLMIQVRCVKAGGYSTTDIPPGPGACLVHTGPATRDDR